MRAILMRSRTKTNPVFYGDELRAELASEEERLERALEDPSSVDLLTWNVFTSLDTHRDRDYLAYRLQGLGGANMTAPVRTSLWTGRRRQPELRPSPAYVRHVRDRAHAAGADDASVASFERTIEVPVRIETPRVLTLVDTTLDALPRGNGGRDRIVELIDAGLEHARRLSKSLAIAVVYQSGTSAAAELSGRMNELRDRAVLAREMPYREHIPEIVLREMSWQQMLAIWERETDYLRLGGQPVRAFRDHLAKLGLRGG
jgi:hypothetical protein